MKKLQNKTFFLLISILTMFLLTILIILNISIYNQEYKQLEEKLIKIKNAHERFNPIVDKNQNPMFMDMEVYVVSLDIRGNIKTIINYTNDGLSDNKIIELVNNNIDRIGEIRNLYFNKYIFSLNNNGDLIIINNSRVKDYLISLLFTSFFLFIGLEMAIIYVSWHLTKWLVKPVIESFDKQKQFIYDASHELKTPLSIIMASAETFEENPNEKKWLDNIKSETHRMSKLVTNLLDLSKSEYIKEQETFSEVNLSKLVESTTLSFESLMFEQSLTLKLDIEDSIMFCCNLDRIKELLSILIDNAIKHGYEQSTINIKLYKEKNIIYLEVQNRGDAIPKDEREKIFERFYRIDKSRNRDANRFGLGLSIAKNIVINHNGHISVDCKNGYTVFKVQFKQNK